MTTCFVAFILAFALAAGVTPFVAWFARRVGAVDHPDGFRKLHKGEMPLLGGIGVFFAFLAPLVILSLFYRNRVSTEVDLHFREMSGLMLGGMIALSLGIADDILELRPRYKLILQVCAAGVAIAAGFRIDSVSVPFGGRIDLGYLMYPVTLFWFLGCMNAVNFLDGLDGLATGVALFVGLTLFIVSLIFTNVFSMLLMACFSGAALGFLLFNFHPAKIFLGDSGSMLLGFLLGALALVSARKAEAAVALLVPVVALGLPIVDTTLSILRRWSRRLPVSAGDRQHVHHVLLSMGLSHRRAVILIYGVCVLLGGAALLISIDRSLVTLMVLGSLAILFYVWVRLSGSFRLFDFWARVSMDMAQRDKASTAYVAVQKVSSRMAAAECCEDLWRAATQVLDVLEFDRASLRLEAGEGRQLDWLRQPSRETEAPPQNVWRASLALQSNGTLLGRIEMEKCVDRSAMIHQAPDIVDRLRQEIASNLARLRALEDAAGQASAVTSPPAEPAAQQSAP